MGSFTLMGLNRACFSEQQNVKQIITFSCANMEFLMPLISKVMREGNSADNIYNYIFPWVGGAGLINLVMD